VNLLVEVEVSKTVQGSEKVSTANLDVNEIINKVRDFVDSIKEVSAGGKPMAVSVDGFNFSLGKSGGKYDLSLKVDLSFKPKEPKPLPFEPF
jgi:hypothetical protein